jgi:hypothetical protein
MFNGGPDLFEVLRRNSEEKRRKGTRKGFLSWFGVQKKEEAPAPRLETPAPRSETPAQRPEGPTLLDRIEHGGERIFTTLPDDSPSPAPAPVPAPTPAVEPPKPVPEIPAAAPAVLEAAPVAIAVLEPPPPKARPLPVQGRAKDIQFTIRVQNLVILCLVFTAMFMLSFVMGYQAGQSPSDSPASDAADSSEMAVVSSDRIPTVEMAGSGRPEGVIAEAPETRAPEGAAPEPSPAPDRANPIALQGRYTLQVATFPPRERARAEALANKLKASGVDSALYTVKGTRSEFVVVCAGTFASRSSSEAKTFERKVKDIREGGRALVSSATLWRSIPQPEVPGVHR